MAAGQAATKPDRHVCKPPADKPPGWLWYCPDCWSGFLYRPVTCRELGGRVINLWVRRDQPGNRGRNAWESVRERRQAALTILTTARR